MAVEHLGMGVEHLAHRRARNELRLAREQRLDAGGVQRALAGARLADQERAHQAGVVLPVDAGELEGQLVARVEPATPRLVAAEQGVAPGADDERIAGVVAAAPEDRAVHGGEDRALVGACPGLRDRRVERGVGQLRGAAYVGELGRGLHQAQAGDQVRGVGCLGEAVERRVQAPAVRRREAVGLVLDAEAFAREALPGEQIAQLRGRIAALAVDPDADVLDDRGVLPPGADRARA